MESRSGIRPSFQPDVKHRVTSLATANIVYKVGKKIIPFQVRNQQSESIAITVINKAGVEISNVVLNPLEFFEPAVFGIKKDTSKSSVDLLIAW